MRQQWYFLNHLITNRCVKRKSDPVFYGRGLRYGNASRYLKSQMRGY